MSKPNNLKEFLTKHDVEIPMLQRDYAQGRESQREVADRFLKAIFEVLEKDGGSLHLDFIYGYMEGKNSVKKLILIDGQQRITTLWLLHLYIYARAGRLDENAKKWLGNFSYSSRESSKEFCENLLKNDFCAQDSPKAIIYDKASEFVKNGDLDNDPTIKAMIHMLDRIHDKFESSRVKFFKSEVNNKLEKICKVSEDTIGPLQDFLNSGEWKDDSKAFECLIDKLDKITFDFFDMGQFKLGEELYVKMNARGKQLSDYENLKAGIEEGLKREDEDGERLKNLTKNIDSDWSDYFGNFRAVENLEGVEKEIEKFDERGRNFLHYGAVYFYCRDSKDKGDKSETKEVARRLREQSIDEIIEQLSSLEKMEVLDRTIGVLSSIEELVSGQNLDLKGLKDLRGAKFFDSKGGKDDDKDEKDAIGRIKVCYFFLILSYMEHRTLEEIKASEASKAQFYDYLCVGRHLIENHPLDNPSDVASFVGLFGFLAQTGKGSVYEIMRDLKRPIDNPSNPFHKNVYALEVRKAGLIAQSRQDGKPWERVLSKTSKNPFLIGWVDFLLDFSDESFEGYKDKQEEYSSPDFDRFERYAELTMGILSDEFLGKESEEDEDKKKKKNLTLFQRAWLSIGDYGFCSTHWFYGNRRKGVYRNREAWNNLLGGKHFGSEEPLFRIFLDELNMRVGEREITTEVLHDAMVGMIKKGKTWWEQLLIKQEGHFDFVNENKDRFQKACRLRFFDENQNGIDKSRRGDKAQAIKVELLQKTDNTNGALDLLDYGFYLYCKEKFNLSEEYNKDNKLAERGASRPMTSRFKLEGHEVYCNSMNCSRTREGKRDIPESSIVIGKKSYKINLDEGCDVFAEFERVLEEARNDGVLSLAGHKG